MEPVSSSDPAQPTSLNFSSSEFFRRDAELTACHCEPGAEFGWRPQLATFASDTRGSGTAHAQETEVVGEKRRQRDFIKKHTGIKGRGKLKKNGNRFLKNLSSRPSSLQSVDPVISSWRRVKHRGYSRAKRTVEPVLDDSDDGDDSSAATVDTEVQLPLPVESVLSEIAKDEIDEVDIIMEDITDEIEDLQQSINATGEGATGNPPRRPVDLECRMTDSMQVMGYRVHLPFECLVLRGLVLLKQNKTNTTKHKNGRGTRYCSFQNLCIYSKLTAML